MPESDHNISDPQGYEDDQTPFSEEVGESSPEQLSQSPDDAISTHASASEPFSVPAASHAGAAFSEPPMAPPKSGRGKFWIMPAAVVALLLISSLSVFAYLYMNRSTPVKTLDSFCTALQHGDYQQAYAAFSSKFQHMLPEPRFASFFMQDQQKVVQCNHGVADDGGSSATTDLTLMHASRGVNNDVVTLAKDTSNAWKITDIARK
jgi:hypothetical protein